MNERELFEEYLGLNALLCQWSDEQERYVGEKGNYFSDMFDCWQARAAKVPEKLEVEDARERPDNFARGWNACIDAMLNKEGA